MANQTTPGTPGTQPGAQGATPHYGDKQLIKHLNNLIELDYDAIEAYEAAIDRLDEAQLRDRLMEYKRDHEQHTQNLGQWVSRLGGEPATKGDFKRVLTKGKVVIGGLGDTKGVLKAMKANEDVTNKKYEQALADIKEPQELVEVIRQNFADEQRHREWLIATIEQRGG